MSTVEEPVPSTSSSNQHGDPHHHHLQPSESTTPINISQSLPTSTSDPVTDIPPPSLNLSNTTGADAIIDIQENHKASTEIHPNQHHNQHPHNQHSNQHPDHSNNPNHPSPHPPPSRHNTNNQFEVEPKPQQRRTLKQKVRHYFHKFKGETLHRAPHKYSAKDVFWSWIGAFIGML